MQVVGMKCSACAEGIGFASEGHACVKCDRAYHTACIQEGKICPSCGEDLEHQAIAIETKEKGATEARLSAGRVQFIFAALLLIALLGFKVAVRLLSSGPPSIEMGLSPAVSVLLILFLLVAMYFGHFWAKVVLGFHLAIAIIGQIGLTYKFVRNFGVEDVFNIAWKLSVLMVLVGCFVLLCFSPSVSLYLESRRPQRFR